MHPLDASDSLAPYRDLFVEAPDVTAYLDGNSLGRPLRATGPRLADFVTTRWGYSLIRGWDEGWNGNFLLKVRLSIPTCGKGNGAKLGQPDDLGKK